jgi:F-type H+-transporting ATPase subunit a
MNEQPEPHATQPPAAPHDAGHAELPAGDAHAAPHAGEHAAAGAHGGGHDDNPLSHVVQHPLIEVPANLGILTPEGKITVFSDQIAMILLAGVLLVALVPMLVRRRRGKTDIDALVATGPANGLEFLCEYIRKEVAEPTLHQYTDRFIKYIWSVFFFVLTVNLLGLLPIPSISSLFGTHLGGTATGNVWMTATLAIMTLGMMVINGLRLGGRHYLAHFCPGPLFMAPLLVPVEIIGLIAKVFALAVRLFANMIAGHILLAVLLSFIMSAGAISTGLGLGVGLVVVVSSVAISLLELFVAFLQAFIFTFLTTLFIGMSVVFHHEGHEEHHDGHDVVQVNPDQAARAV